MIKEQEMAKAFAKDTRRPVGPAGVVSAPVLSMELGRRRAWERGRLIAANLLGQMDKRLSAQPSKPKRKSK